MTPFRGFVREATRRNLETRITILYSVRTPRDIIFKDEFHQLALDNPHFNFAVTCTRLTPEDEWTGRRGRIDAPWVQEHIHDLPNTVFYACGPNELVDSVENLLRGRWAFPRRKFGRKRGWNKAQYTCSNTHLFGPRTNAWAHGSSTSAAGKCRYTGIVDKDRSVAPPPAYSTSLTWGRFSSPGQPGWTFSMRP